MSGWRAMACGGCGLALMGAAAVRGQTPTRKAKDMSFRDAKPVMGLPDSIPRNMARCSANGIAFFEGHNSADDSKPAQFVYNNALSGDGKKVNRVLPAPEYDVVSTVDFY